MATLDAKGVAMRTCVRYARRMPARFTIALPDDPELIARLTVAVAEQSDPPISIGRIQTAVVAFEAETGEMMLRSRVMQALEDTVGPDWSSLVQAL